MKKNIFVTCFNNAVPLLLHLHRSRWYRMPNFTFGIKTKDALTLLLQQACSSKATSLLSFFVLLIFTSCEKVIDVKLKEADKKYVIEGNVSNIAGQPPEVRLSQTKSFADNNNFVGISGAVVTIQVNNGTIYPLTESIQGVYRTTAFTGTPGSTYKLSVSINGNIFTATSQLPVQLIALDNITAEDLSFGAGTIKVIHPDYKDPQGLGNSYRFIEYANGAQVKKVFVQDDAISDGLRITRPLIDPDGDLKRGDVVKVEMLCIDPAVYKYWYSLDQAATGNSQSATPANPVSNISGGAMGYFSAHSMSSKTIIVP